MQRLWLHLAIILVVLAFLGSAIWPPGERLRGGKDLRGGVTLMYSVQIGPGENASEIMGRLIDVLKRRVDPTNQLDISITAQGRDRIEVTMPLPNERVKQLRRDFEAKLAEISEVELTQADFDLLVRQPPDVRDREIDRIARGDAALATLLREAAQARDTAAAVRVELATARDEGAPPERIRELVRRAGDAEVRLAEIRERVLAGVLRPEDLRRALSLSAFEVRKLDRTTNQLVTMPSERARALDRLRQIHPDKVDRINAVVAAFENYERQRKSLDDPADLKRLLRGAGVLDFRIAVDPASPHPEEERLRRELRELGPRNVRPADPPVGWFKINRIENWFDSKQEGEMLIANPVEYFRAQGYVCDEYGGQYFMLLYDKPDSRLTRAEGKWSVAGANRGQDRMGRPAIDFTMDAAGAILLGNLTQNHVGQKMAVLMDDEVYTAPVLISRIGRSGQITGNFPPDELNYIIRTLSAGSLQAKLSPEPLSEVTLAPEFGLDNLMKGLEAGMISFILCSAFMVVYYFACGGIAVVGLVINCILLVGVMAINAWTFTLPGIAGVILTFAIAVDANVLIYERVREEILRGEDLKTSMRLGYQRAFSAIIDGNLTNLIVCVILISVGTQEIRGFGITMSIGVLTTLFSQLYVTRFIVIVLVDKLGWKKARMLPLVVPAIERFFTPKINWLKIRHALYGVSVGLVALGFAMALTRGEEMFDTEFRGGTAVTIRLKPGDDGKPIKATRQDIQDKLRAITDRLDDPRARLLATASIQVQNPEPDGVSSSEFKIKTLVTDMAFVETALADAFADITDAQPRVTFRGSDLPPSPAIPAYPITERVLGASIERPTVLDNVEDFLGGAAIVLENLDPPISAESLKTRVDQQRVRPQFVDASTRPTRVVVLSGTPEAMTSAVILVRDESISYFTSPERWSSELRDREWDLVTSALAQSTRLMGVESFSPAIARQFVARAIAAAGLSILLVVIYVWVRFNSVRFSIAAIVPTLHDCFIVIGLIAFAEILCDLNPGIAQSLGLLPFKIDLTVVAAVLTVLGYSINDKIVVLDRIRENRGKAKHATSQIVNDAVNQTISRTVITGTTTIIATVVMYWLGGESVRAFAYSLGIGVAIGTFSSISLGAPLAWAKRFEKAPKDDMFPQVGPAKPADFSPPATSAD